MEYLKYVATLASWIDSAKNDDIEEWFPTIELLWSTNLAGPIEELPKQLQQVRIAIDYTKEEMKMDDSTLSET